MMDIKMFFNVLLLALSLATVLVTLISFILYKLRQLSDKNQLKDPYQLEGLYFSRIAPHLEDLNKKYRLENQIKVKKVNSKLSLGSMFLIIVGIIASSLFAQIYFTDIQERRKKIAISENYRQLVDQGLLKRYDYSPSFDEKNLKYKIEQNHTGYIDYVLEQLKNKKIILAISDNTNMKTDYSYNSWEQFLTRFEIPFKKQKISQIQKADVVILPRFEILKSTEKVTIENLKKNKVSLLATGPIARLDGTREKTDGTWTKNFFGVEFLKCSETSIYPIYFKRTTQMLLNIPNNYTSNWPQIQKEYCAHSNSNDEHFEIGSIEVSYDGMPRYIDKSQKYLIVNSVLQTANDSRIIWQSMDPQFAQLENRKDGKYENEFSYEDQIILQSMHWLSYGVEIQISDWPNNVKSMNVISLPYLIDNTKSEKVVRYLIELNIPATIFLSSSGINSFKEALNGRKLGKLELASYFDKYYPPLSEKFDINKLDFKEIEKNRLDIEEEASLPVSGIYIRPDKINKSVYYSSIINQFKYILSSGLENGQIIHRIKSQNFVHFNIPDPDTNDKIEKENRTIASINEKSSLNEFSDLHIYHFYDLDGATNDKIDNLISKSSKEQFSTYKEIAQWLVLRSQINFVIHEGKDSENEIKITIENDNDSEFNSLNILLGSGEWSLVSELVEQENIQIKDQILIINKLKPMEKISFNLKRTAIR